jgi:phosphoserine phosphatase
MSRQAKLRLVAFDMEGCLTADPTVWELMHRSLGTWDSHGAPYWERYKAGEFDYDSFARMDVAVWKDAPHDALLAAAGSVALMPGCADLLTALRRAGVHVAVISNGLHCVADRFREAFGVEHIFANGVGTRDDRLTGELDLRMAYDDKGTVLAGLARTLGVSREETAAVGDSSSDIAMFREARLGIAFRPFHEAVADAATHVVKESDLGLLSDILFNDG